MSEREPAVASGDVDEAMNRILRAEQEARAAVEACREEAAALLAAAERRAKRVVERADRRIRLAHRLADEAVERAVRDLLGAQAEGAEANPPASVSAALDLAVAALAAEIIGAQP